MRTLIYIIVLLTIQGLLTLTQCSVKAQPFVDVLNFQYQRFPERNYINDSDASLTTEQIIGNLFIPLELKNKNVIVLGSSYEGFRFKRTTDDSIVKSNLYAISLQLGGIKQWKNEKWSTLFLVIPKISSDLQELSIEDYQLGGVVLFTYKKKENLKYKFGLYYNREFFGNFFMPLAGIEWKVNKRLNVFGVLPGGMNLEYKLNKKLYLGASYKAITASFRLSKSIGSPYVREGHPFWGHNQLKALLNYYPAKNLVLFSEFGHTFWRQYTLYNNQNNIESFHPVYREFKNGIFFNLGIALRVRLDNEEDSSLNEK